MFNSFYDNTGGGYKAGLIQDHWKPISYIEVSDNYFEMTSPSPVIWPMGVCSPPAPVWNKATAYSAGELIVDSNGNIERVAVAGTSAATAPAWAISAGLQTVEVGGLTWQNIGARTSYTAHLKVSGNTFNKMEFGVWVDNNNHFDQVKNVEFVNNTCLNLQDVNTILENQEATGLWADGAALQPIENLIVTGNRFLNEANNAGYMYGIVLGFQIDNLYLGTDNVFSRIKKYNVYERSLTFNSRGPVIEASSMWDPGNLNAGSNAFAHVKVPGALLGDLAAASFSLDVQGLVLSSAVTATDIVRATLSNTTASVVTLNQGTLFIKVTKKAIT